MTDGLFGTVSFMVIKWHLLKQHLGCWWSLSRNKLLKTRVIQCSVPRGSRSCSECTIRSLVSPLLGMKPPRTLLSSSLHLSAFRNSLILLWSFTTGKQFSVPREQVLGGYGPNTARGMPSHLCLSLAHP